MEIFGDDATDRVLGESDVVVLTAPLTGDTAGMIGASQLQTMRESAWLINIARGRLVDETALRRALENGWIGGRGPRRVRRGAAPARLGRLRHAEPDRHPAHLVVERPRRGSGLELFVANLRHYLAGEPLENVVDLEAGY